MSTPEPGVYPGVSFDDYSEWEAVNHSTLVHFASTPAHAYHAVVNQKEKPSTNLGHLVHTAILQPELLEKEYMAVPKVDKRTKEGKRQWAEFERAAEGRMLVQPAEMECATALRRRVREHATLREMLASKGANELSMLWIDPDLGLPCKGRIDRICELQKQSFILDFKTHGFVATRKSWESAVQKFGYHTQAAWYKRGLEILRPMPEGIPERRFAWGVCETVAPYLVRVFDVDEDTLQIGLDEVMRYAQTFAKCKQTGEWPGWDEGMQTAGLPPWAMKGFADD